MQALRILSILLALICAVPLRAEAGGRVRSRLRAQPTLKITRYNFARSTPGPGATVGLSGEPVTVVRDAAELVCQSGSCVEVAANQLAANASGAQVYGAGTNLLSTSSYATGANFSVEAATAPDGTSTAFQITKLVDTINASYPKSFTATAARHTASIWIKSGTATEFRFGIFQESAFPSQTGYIVSGTATSISGTGVITVAGVPANTWIQVATTTAAAMSAATASFYIYPAYGTGNTGKTFSVWRPQVEAAVVPSPARAVDGAPLSWPATKPTTSPYSLRNPVWGIDVVASSASWPVTTFRGLVALGTSTTNATALYLLNGYLYFDVHTKPSSFKMASFAVGSLAPGLHRFSAFDDTGALSIYLDGAKLSATIAGTGPGVFQGDPGIVRFGADTGGTGQLQGELQTVTLCQGCTSPEQMQ